MTSPSQAVSPPRPRRRYSTTLRCDGVSDCSARRLRDHQRAQRMGVHGLAQQLTVMCLTSPGAVTIRPLSAISSMPAPDWHSSWRDRPGSHIGPIQGGVTLSPGFVLPACISTRGLVHLFYRLFPARPAPVSAPSRIGSKWTPLVQILTAPPPIPDHPDIPCGRRRIVAPSSPLTRRNPICARHLHVPGFLVRRGGAATLALLSTKRTRVAALAGKLVNLLRQCRLCHLCHL